MGRCENSTIDNCLVEIIHCEGKNLVGGLVGTAIDTDFENCHIEKGDISRGTSPDVESGGLVARIELIDKSVDVKKCFSNASMNFHTKGMCGGLIGRLMAHKPDLTLSLKACHTDTNFFLDSGSDTKKLGYLLGYAESIEADHLTVNITGCYTSGHYSYSGQPVVKEDNILLIGSTSINNLTLTYNTCYIILDQELSSLPEGVMHVRNFSPKIAQNMNTALNDNLFNNKGQIEGQKYE